jgi:hypothetical protein
MSNVVEHKVETADGIVDRIIHAYYNEHHNINKYRSDLADAIRTARVEGFMECKRRVVEGIDYREKRTQDSIDVLESERKKLTPDGRASAYQDDLESRVAELAVLRGHIKGMVAKRA